MQSASSSWSVPLYYYGWNMDSHTTKCGPALVADSSALFQLLIIVCRYENSMCLLFVHLFLIFCSKCLEGADNLQLDVRHRLNKVTGFKACLRVGLPNFLDSI